MAGSRKSVIYTADDGAEYVVNMDESNSELAGFGFQDYDDTAAANPLIKPFPKGWQMRYINCTYFGGTPINVASRKLFVGSPSVVAAVIALASVLLPWFVGGGGFQAFIPTGYVAQKVKSYNPRDTGLTDGDDT